MALNQNQFGMSVVKGQMDLRFNQNMISCEIDSSSAGGLIAGQPVKLVDSAGGIPKIVELAADTDEVFGFINYDLRRATFGAYDKVEVAALRGNIMYMEAASAIARGAPVMCVLSGVKVDDLTSGKTCIGRALDKAANAGDLIRVVIDLPSGSGGVAANVAAVTTANATDLATAEALANQLKTTVNAIIAALQAAGLMR